MRDHLTEGLAWLAEGAEQAEAPEKSSSSEIQDSHEANDGDVSASKAHALAATAAPALAGGDPIVPPTDEIVRALGPNALQMEGKDGKPGGVVISDIPLAVPDPDAEDGGDWQPADLTFKTQDSRLVATRSLVATSVPDAADGTFRVGPLGVKLAPEGSDSTATSYDTSVIHPNVATDTDLATRSVGSGLKFGWVLRSPDAAQTQRAKLDLPRGANATLVDGDAVRITDEQGNQIGTVSPAAATDADGLSVPIDTSLEGDTVSYRLKTDLAKLKTPVVIDPEMLYEWGVNGDTDTAGWVGAKNAAPFSWSMPVGNTTNQAANGLMVEGAAGTGYAANTWGGWTHWAPGDDTYGSLSPVSNQIVSPEHGFFWKAEFGGLNYTLNSPYSYQDPNVNIGVLSSTDVYHPPVQRYQKQNATGGWNAPVATNLRQIPAGTLGATYRVYVGTDSTTPPTSLTLAKSDSVFSAVLYDFGLYGAGTVARPKSQLRIGWTKLWAADNYDPAMANITSPTGWVKEDYALPVLATDRGTGIEKVEFYSQGANPQMYGPGVAKTCVATGKELCPFTFNDTVPVAPLPEGIGTYDLRATDGGGRKATKPATLKVDKSAPELTLTGDLYTQRTAPIGLAEDRAVVVQANDGVEGGSSSQQRSGVARIDIYVDDELRSSTDQTQTGDSKPLSATWTLPAADTEVGEHEVRVVAVDRAGNEKLAPFTVSKSPTDDVDAPEPQMAGELPALENGYVPNDRPALATSIGVEVPSGPDQGSGVERVAIEIDGQEVFGQAVPCTDAEPDPMGCDSYADVDTQVSFASYAEGTHAVQAVATDDEGNTGRTEAWTVKVDRTPPAAASEAIAALDADTGITSIMWGDDADPDLVGTTEPGSGTSKWTYRYRVAAGSWTAWTVTDNPVVEVSGLALGTAVDVEVKSADAVGNEAQSGTLSTVVEPVPTTGAEAPVAFTRERAAAPPDVPRCTGDTVAPWRGDLGGETGIAINAIIDIDCNTPGARNIGRYSLTTCVQHRPSGGVFGNIGCDVRMEYGDAQVEVSAICRAGNSQDYRLRAVMLIPLHVKVTSHVNVFESEIRQRDCNEAGAWRRTAYVNAQSPSDPRAQLRAHMSNGYNPGLGTVLGDIQQRPTTGGSGRGVWEAHHIVPINEKKYEFPRAQAIAYACDIPRNGALNGVYLRGWRLAKTGARYDDLPPSHQARAYHGSLRGPSYASWVADQLRPYINNDGTCNDAAGMRAKVRAIGERLKDNPPAAYHRK